MRSHALTSLLKTLGAIIALAFVGTGCGSVEETTTEGWEAPPPVSVTARLEYRIDSLMNENRRMQQRVDALAAENRSLNARNADLEMRLTEALKKPEPPPPPADLTQAYSEALAQYRARNFEEAIRRFEQLLAAGIREDLVDNCHYWIGESNYGLRRYAEAITSFRRVYDYPRSEKKDDAQLMIGNSYLAMGDRAKAREAFEAVVSSYPASPYVSKAQERLAGLR